MYPKKYCPRGERRTQKKKGDNTMDRRLAKLAEWLDVENPRIYFDHLEDKVFQISTYLTAGFEFILLLNCHLEDANSELCRRVTDASEICVDTFTVPEQVLLYAVCKVRLGHVDLEALYLSGKEYSEDIEAMHTYASEMTWMEAKAESEAAIRFLQDCQSQRCEETASEGDILDRCTLGQSDGWEDQAEAASVFLRSETRILAPLEFVKRYFILEPDFALAPLEPDVLGLVVRSQYLAGDEVGEAVLLVNSLLETDQDYRQAVWNAIDKAHCLVAEDGEVAGLDVLDLVLMYACELAKTGHINFRPEGIGAPIRLSEMHGWKAEQIWQCVYADWVDEMPAIRKESGDDQRSVLRAP